MVFERLRKGEVAVILRDTEIGRGELFLQQDDLRPLACGLPDGRFGPVGVLGQVPGTGELRGGESDVAHLIGPEFWPS